MAEEEAFLVVVGIDEPAGDAVGAVGAHLAALRMEDINAVDAHLQQVATRAFSDRQDVDVRLAEDHEQITLTGVRQLGGHVQVGVHACLQNRHPAELGEVR